MWWLLCGLFYYWFCFFCGLVYVGNVFFYVYLVCDLFEFLLIFWM